MRNEGRLAQGHDAYDLPPNGLLLLSGSIGGMANRICLVLLNIVSIIVCFLDYLTVE